MKQKPISPRRSIITIATGLDSYFNMAINMARSVEYHNKNLPIIIVTDRERRVPKDLRRTKAIAVQDIDRGFKAKLTIDLYLQTEETLFLDSDCIVLGDLEPIFNVFNGKSVGVLGITRTSGEFFGDIEKIRSVLNLEYFLMFNGGLYYFRQSAHTTEIMNFARSLLPQYDEIGFVRLRNQPNEEVLVSAALSHYRQQPAFNDGGLYADFQWWPLLQRLEPLRGEALLLNPEKGHKLHQSRFPAASARPIVLHFLGHHAEGWRYKYVNLSYRLALRRFPLPAMLAKLAVLPQHLQEIGKTYFRPTYRALFGTRRIKVSNARQLGE